jgi:hypothetical protein
MFTAQQDRAKTAEDGGFPGAPCSPGEDGESRNLEQTRTTLVENEQWLAHNADKIVRALQCEIVPTSEYNSDKRAVLVKEDEYVLRCLGEFDQDSSISPPEQAARLKELIARFLHNHNGRPTE